MSQTPRLRIFLSSPGDVAEERHATRQVVDRLRYDPDLQGKMMLEVVAWDDPDTPTALLASKSLFNIGSFLNALPIYNHLDESV